MKKKSGVVSVLVIVGLLVPLSVVAGADSEFTTSLTAGDPAINLIHLPEYPQS